MVALTVRVERPDGSRSYRGHFRGTSAEAKAARERDAWRDAGWGAEVVAANDPDVATWRRATRDGGRYFPERDADPAT